jgi:uncharacterized protein
MGAAFLPLRPPRHPWRTLGRTSACLALTLLALLSVAFAINFPALTGRVVDQANIIPADSRAAIEAKLADLEAKSGIQLVVATVSSLDGQEIEPYANELFRAWKLGEKTRNNGVLLLVAPNERRVRIEVGYGLEGTLTDALSQVIIANAITPRFKTGDYTSGITRGVDDIITVLTTDASEWQQRPSLRLDRAPAPAHINWLAVVGIIIVLGLMIVSPGFRWFILGMLMSGRNSGGGGFGGGRSGGGFSGGGGSSGGGGASGRW